MKLTSKTKNNSLTAGTMLIVYAAANLVWPIWTSIFGDTFLYNNQEALFLFVIFLVIVLGGASLIGWHRGNSSWLYVLIGTMLYAIPVMVLGLFNLPILSIGAHCEDIYLSDQLRWTFTYLLAAAVVLAITSFISGWLRARFFLRKSSV